MKGSLPPDAVASGAVTAAIDEDEAFELVEGGCEEGFGCRGVEGGWWGG